MSVFDQRYQKVTYQYNVNGTINFDDVHTKVKVVNEIKKLETEVGKAVEGNAIETDLAADVEHKIKKAVIQAQKPNPDKENIIHYLKEAKQLLTNVAAVAGLVHGITQAIEVVRKFF